VRKGYRREAGSKEARCRSNRRCATAISARWASPNLCARPSLTRSNGRGTDPHTRWCGRGGAARHRPKRPRRDRSSSGWRRAPTGSRRRPSLATVRVGIDLHHQRRRRTDQGRFCYPTLSVPRQIMRHLASTGGMANKHRILQVEMCGQSCQVIGIWSMSWPSPVWLDRPWPRLSARSHDSRGSGRTASERPNRPPKAASHG
jgi:hypothetical protein